MKKSVNLKRDRKFSIGSPKLVKKYKIEEKDGDKFEEEIGDHDRHYVQQQGFDGQVQTIEIEDQFIVDDQMQIEDDGNIQLEVPTENNTNIVSHIQQPL